MAKGEMGKKLGEMGNGRNGIGRNEKTPLRQTFDHLGTSLSKH